MKTLEQLGTTTADGNGVRTGGAAGSGRVYEVPAGARSRSRRLGRTVSTTDRHPAFVELVFQLFLSKDFRQKKKKKGRLADNIRV